MKKNSTQSSPKIVGTTGTCRERGRKKYIRILKSQKVKSQKALVTVAFSLYLLFRGGFLFLLLCVFLFVLFTFLLALRLTLRLVGAFLFFLQCLAFYANQGTSDTMSMHALKSYIYSKI